VVIDEGDGGPQRLAIVDYKTSTDIDREGEQTAYDLQLQVYADAGRREGLEVAAAYVHDLKNKHIGRHPVDVSFAAVERAESVVIEAAARLRSRSFEPNPGARCARCEVRTICPERT
jgi:DNA helicase-2/ATP-dependent DNA helicase PcrA